MKTPKEKAEELVKKFSNPELYLRVGYQFAYEYTIKCAKVAVDEIIDSTSICEWENEDDIDFGDYFEYWQEVKNELNKM